VGPDAIWRTSRRSHWSLLTSIQENGCHLSPLLTSVPWLDARCFRVDWLHAADQGVTADYLANLFVLLLTKLPGATKKDRCTSLWEKVQKFYVDFAVHDRLQNLVLTMMVQGKKAYKLRCSAAQCRALVPLGNQLAMEMLDMGDPVEGAARFGMFHLFKCYEALSGATIFFADALRVNSTRFALQYVALEKASTDPRAWRIKPKLHLFLELCSDGSMPSMIWAYRDEDYGGSVARMSRRRGGVLSAHAFSRNLLQRFKIAQPVIRLVPSTVLGPLGKGAHEQHGNVAALGVGIKFGA